MFTSYSPVNKLRHAAKRRQIPSTDWVCAAINTVLTDYFKLLLVVFLQPKGTNATIQLI
jgi:hypothetical protein